MSEQAIIAFEGEVGYKDRLLLKGVQIAVEPQSFTAIIGPNGTGKSTLVKTLIGLQRPLLGVVKRKAGSTLGYVPQGATLDAIFPLRVSELVAQGALSKGRLFCRPDEKAVIEALDRMQIAALKDKPFRDLSGGQKQRVLIARALYRKPELLVLDEPTAGLDLPTENELLDVLSALHREGTTILWIAHHLASVLNRVQIIAAVDASAQRLDVGPVDRFDSARLQKLYQKPLELVVLPDGTRSVQFGRAM